MSDGRFQKGWRTCTMRMGPPLLCRNLLRRGSSTSHHASTWSRNRGSLLRSSMEPPPFTCHTPTPGAIRCAARGRQVCHTEVKHVPLTTDLLSPAHPHCQVLNMYAPVCIERNAEGSYKYQCVSEVVRSRTGILAGIILAEALSPDVKVSNALNFKLAGFTVSCG